MKYLKFKINSFINSLKKIFLTKKKTKKKSLHLLFLQIINYIKIDIKKKIYVLAYNIKTTFNLNVTIFICSLIFFLYFEIDTPLFLENTTFLLTYATIFLVLMSLGIALTKFKFSLKNSIILSLCRVIIGPSIAFAVIYNFDLSGLAAGVLLIQSAMPSAILNYLVGSMYSPKKIVDSVASTIVVSTLMSFITIPIVVFFALKYFN